MSALTRSNMDSFLSCGFTHTCLLYPAVCWRLKVRDMAVGDFISMDKRQHDVLKCLLDVALQQELNGILEPRHLPKKYLPPGKRSELYHLYIASCMAAKTDIASVKTFYRAFEQSGFSKILRFRPKTQHTECLICSKLKASIASSKNFVEHAEYCDQYHRHLGGMFADRRIYATLRARVSGLLE